ncbi:MAG: bifunctional adenosylcobinamide kinase/adenosylcobinamide-phosphate guanylyltransferase, partial [Solirubrobacteraceae bacterium]
MTLVVALGGVRSGKSAWAERQAAELAGDAGVTVLATADPADRSMHDRIARHQARRDASWTTVEILARDDLAAALPERGVALLDGLGGRVAAVLDRAGAFVDDAGRARAARQRAADIVQVEIERLLETVAGDQRALVVATEEAGLGVVPMGAGTAAWVDLLGELNQRLVRAADLAVVVVAGRALPLTDTAEPLPRTEPSPSFTVLASSGAAGAPTPPEDGERRAHPRLLGAGAIRTVASPRSTPGRPDPGAADDAPRPLPSGSPAATPPAP